MEGAIQEASNAVGRCATEEALKRFDTDGSPMRVGAVKLTARGRDAKDYQSPYGVVRLERYVYQSSRGGRIYCPLEHRGRIIRGATPRFASQLSHKYAQLNVRALQSDLEKNHGRQVATSRTSPNGWATSPRRKKRTGSTRWRSSACRSPRWWSAATAP